MNLWQDAQTGNRIDSVRYHDETVTLRPEPTLGEIFLSDLREFVRQTEYLPEWATVHPRDHGIEINHRIYDETAADPMKNEEQR